MTSQLTIRADSALIERVRDDARRLDRSMNEHVVKILEASTNPEHALDEHAEVRERLRRAGVLSEWPRLPADRWRPTQAQIDDARAAAGRGTPLSQIVSELRDEEG
ncbi:MAG: transcriptional regulator [Ilumatobacteraceae bacterium]